MGLARAENVLDATANTDCFVEVSGILKAHACNLIKISGDLRLLHFLREIELPAVQAGSSIMPGKVNPVVLEAVIQSAMAAISHDRTITEACSRSTLQINEFMPLVSWAMLGSLDLLCAANQSLSGHAACIRANEVKCREYFERSPVIITALLPHVGYERAEELLKEFTSSGRESLKDFLVDKLGKDLIEKTFAPGNLTSLGYK
jgi:aspartate ammonia-lyase